jgi:WD40 repeat protein
MGRIFLVTSLGIVLFLAAIWQLGLLEPSAQPRDPAGPDKVADPATLGKDLYEVAGFPPIPEPKLGVTDPIVLYGVMTAIEQEDVGSQVPGRILFIGEQVDESAVLAAGSAAFLAEPYYYATVYAGEDFVKFYRRLYEGQTVKKNQMVALIEPAKALGEVLVKKAKVEYAFAERDAAIAGEKEGSIRYVRAKRLHDRNALSAEELGSAELTWKKLESERKTKEKSVNIAEIEERQADIELRLHAIRPVMPFENSSIKSILRQRGAAVKPGDPVLVVHNLDRLQVEALIEEQYYSHLKKLEKKASDKKKQITATIEPTILEKPFELPGHDKDVNSVAISRDLKIVSGGEDKKVCVWLNGGKRPLKNLEHEDAVKVVACAPAPADKNNSDALNLCLAGCANGDIYLWDLDAERDEPLKIIPAKDAHGENNSITSLAFSPDGKYFASGGSDGSIRLWSADGTDKYPFTPEHGVKQCHEDAVTSLHFTKQCRLISAGRDKTLRVWFLKEKGAFPDRKAIHDRIGNVPQLGVSHDGKWMLFDQGSTLKLISVESRTLTNTLKVPVNSTPFETLAVFSPDDKLILTAGAPEGRLQLWSTPDTDGRAYEVRQFATKERQPVSCAAFSPDAGNDREDSFAVSASGHLIYVWPIPTKQQVEKHRIKDVEMTLKTHSLDPSTRQSRVGFEVANPGGLFEAGRPATIVIDE